MNTKNDRITKRANSPSSCLTSKSPFFKSCLWLTSGPLRYAQMNPYFYTVIAEKTMSTLPPTAHDDEITLTDIWIKLQQWWAYLWKRKFWIVAIALLGSIGGYLKVKTADPVYSATLTFSLEQGGEGGSNLAGLASQFGFSMGGDGGGMFSGENLLTLMKSRRMVEDVLLTPVLIGGDSILLVNQYVQSWPELKEAWDSAGLYPLDAKTCCNNAQDSAMGVIYAMVSQKALAVSKQDEALSFVTISFSGHDEAFTGAFVEQLTAKATEFYVESKTTNTRANMEKLERRVDSVTTELESAMVGAANSIDANQFTVQSASKVSSSQKQMKVTMLTTLYGELVKNLELSKTMAAREEPLITIIDRPHYPLRVRESGLKGAIFGGVIGGFLTVLFFAGREFIKDLNKQAKEAQQLA